MLRALAHPTRLEILARLAEGPSCVGAIRDLLEVSQPNLSQHLSVLRKEGLVDFEEKGKQRCYCLTRPALVRDLLGFISGARLRKEGAP